MNIEEIDKWLDNEYGMSYTKLEELHDYFFEKYTDQKEKIERLHSIIKEVREYIYENSYDEERKEIIDELWVNEIKDILKILDKDKQC